MLLWKIAYNVVTRIWAPLALGQMLYFSRGFCQIIAPKIIASVAGRWYLFHTVMEHFLLAMCKYLSHYCIKCHTIDRIDPVKVGNDTIYFRGIEIIDHVIEALLNLGVNKAEQVVLTGCSGISHTAS